MFDPSANDSASHNLSKLGAAASTENATPYGLPIESVSNLTVAGQDLVTVAFDAAADHLLKGKTRVSFAIKNQGSVAAGPFKANVVYSKDATIGNGDDIVIKSLSVGRLNAGGKLSRSLNVALPLDELNGSAIKEDRPNRGGNYVSRNRDYLGVVIDANNQVSESNERNNVSQKEGVGKDGITYFPWDINGDGRVTGNDVNFVKSRLGRTGGGADPRADFDGDRKITDIDLAAISDRVGYRINPKVISPSIIALQPKQNGQREPVIEGVITDFNNVKTVRAKFTNAPKKNFVNITRDIGKAGDFSLNANRIKAIYGAALPGGKNQQLQIEILDKKGKNIGKKRVTFGAASTGPDKPRNDPGESTQRALRIGQLKSKKVLTDSVSDSDRLDYYRFDINSISDFTIDLNVFNDRFDANVSIVDKDGKAVFDPAEINSTDEFGKTILEKGTYYAKVEENGFRSSTGYRLSLEAKALTGNRPANDPGETTARAFNLGKLSDTQTLNAAISDSDALDYYRFELEQESDFTVDLDVINERFDANVSIVDDAGKAVFNPSEINSTDEFGTTLLEAGTYYAKVQENGFRSGTAYSLKLGAVAAGENPSTDAGDTPARATDIGVLGATQTINAFISDSDSLDYYRFDLNSVSNFTIDLDVLNERFDANVSIVDEFDKTVFNPSEINSTDEFGKTLLEAGTYYAKVQENGFRSGTEYNLRLGATPIRNNVPPTDAGDSTNSAYNLGRLTNGTKRLRSFISDADPLDYYQFQVNGSKKLRVNLDVLNERFDANVKIVDRFGATVFNPPETNSTDELGVTRINAGTYYAVVSENGFRSGTEYDLRLGIS